MEHESFFNPEFWVGVAFLGFIALLLYYKVPGLVSKALDGRAETIRKELDEARKLRDEAAAILADYKKRRAEAAKEGEALLSHARVEAAEFAAETRASLKDMLDRRTRMAQDKIARAETQAAAEVRSAAIDAAVAAAHHVISGKVQGDTAHAMVKKSIGGLKSLLN